MQHKELHDSQEVHSFSFTRLHNGPLSEADGSRPPTVLKNQRSIGVYGSKPAHNLLVLETQVFLIPRKKKKIKLEASEGTGPRNSAAHMP